MWNLIFLITGFLFLVLVTYIYYSKQKLDSRENRIFKAIMIANFVEYLVEIPLQIFTRTMDVNGMIVDIFTKFYLISIFVIFSIFSLYTFYITLKGDVQTKEAKYIKFRRFFLVYVFINCIIFLILPVMKYYDASKMYAYGLGVEFLKLSSGIYLLFWLSMIFLNIKNIRDKKFLPLIVVVLLIITNVVVQTYDPSILISTVLGTFTCYTMFFTIENPDLKMIELLNTEKERADKANQAKSDFLSSMSHEIRTPLNAIVGFSECVMQSDTLDEAKDNAKDIVGASQTLLEIVNGILDISKIESGKIELIECDYSPAKMLEETVKLAKGRLADKPLDFQVNIAPDLPRALYGDKFNIKKILVNFLTNAIKYTDEGFVRFDVQCVKLNGYVRLIFIVSDSGRGIKKEDISKLFTKFQRLDEEKNQTIEGTGLGLAITKQLIDMMKGSVVVDSVYGEGSKFTFVLDQKLSDAVLDDTTTKFDVVVDLTGKKILVVDDNKLNLKVADKLLKVYNPSLTMCDSGADCIDLITNGNSFDLILLDDMMPGMSGVETLHKLKEDSSFNIPTIALTANAINGMKEKYLDAGFDGYLAKPIDKGELNRALVKFLGDASNTKEEDNTEHKDEPVQETPKIDEQQVVNEEVNTPQEEITPVEEETNDTVVEAVNETPNNSIPKFTPSNTPIVVLPGDKEKDNNSEEVNETTNEESDNSNKILLIVDDNNINIKVESKLISSLGYKVESANSGVEAINMVKNNKYDLIFMDIMMPMMDGVQTLHELKKIDGFDVPVVALTADAVFGAKEKYLSEGFDLYVTKPANKDDFDKIIKKYVD